MAITGKPQSLSLSERERVREQTKAAKQNYKSVLKVGGTGAGGGGKREREREVEEISNRSQLATLINDVTGFCLLNIVPDSPWARYRNSPPGIFGDNDFWIAQYVSFQYLLVCKMNYSAFGDYLRWYIAA